MRDGTLLAAMVRFPDAYIYGDGPYPTVIEYSGYSPSRPDRMDSGTRIANALGFATVSVNMRGTGCSGGVFDVFNRAQHADGYDVVEIVAGQPWVLNNQVGMIGLSHRYFSIVCRLDQSAFLGCDCAFIHHCRCLGNAMARWHL